MPLLALIVTDGHNIENLFDALPAGSTYTFLALSRREWAKSSGQIAAEYLQPMIARSQQVYPPERSHA